jgi:hypothetical protein
MEHVEREVVLIEFVKNYDGHPEGSLQWIDADQAEAFIEAGIAVPVRQGIHNYFTRRRL